MTKSIVSNLFKTLAFGLVLVAIALAFAACGDKDPKVEGFSVYLDGELVSDSNKTITLDYNNTANWEEKITVKLNYSDDTQKVITKGNDGYTITGIPTTLDAGTYELTIKYGTYNGVVVNLVIHKVSIDMSEVEWSETTSFNYDGQEKKVELTNLPQGVTATYEGNTGTNAGDYTATATLVYDKKNYELTNNTIQLTKEWSIEKAIISMGNVSWNIKENFTYDGTEKKVELKNLPSQVTATYENNTATDAGTYTAKATLVYDEENYILKNYDVDDLIWIINPSEDYEVTVSASAQYFVDTLPTLSVSENEIEGEVTWDKDQEKVFGQETAYSWTFTPENQNYATKTGTINLTQVSGYNQTYSENIDNVWTDNSTYIYKDCTFNAPINSSKKVDLTFDGCTFTTGYTGDGGDKCIYLTSFTNLVVNGCTFGGETTEGTMSTAGYALDLNIYSTTVDRIEITNNNFNTTKGEDAESVAISIKVRLGETDKPTDVKGTIGSITNGVLILGNTFANTCDTIYIGSGPKGSTNANISTGAFNVEVSNNKNDVKVLERYLYPEGVVVPEQLVKANDAQTFGNKQSSTFELVSSDNFSQFVEALNNAEYEVIVVNSVSYTLAQDETLTIPEDKTVVFNNAGFLGEGTIVNKGYFITVNNGNIIANVSNYSSISSAVQFADQVVVSKDIVVEDTIAVNKEVVLDLNGKKLYNVNDIWDTANNNWSIISVRQNGNLTVKGDGIILAKENDCYGIDVVDGGLLTVESGEIIGNISSIYVYEGRADIKGGKYSIQQLNASGDPYAFVLNLLDVNRENGTATISVTGGTFEKFNPQNNKAEGENTNFVAEGYVSSLVEGSEDTYVVTKA